MTQRNVLSSEFFYLKPNDIVYVEPLKGKQFAFTKFPYSVIFGFIYTAILSIYYLK